MFYIRRPSLYSDRCRPLGGRKKTTRHVGARNKKNKDKKKREVRFREYPTLLGNTSKTPTMLAIFLRQDYPELAKVVHSLSGTVTTIFLFTRLCTFSVASSPAFCQDGHILCTVVLNVVWAHHPQLILGLDFWAGRQDTRE